MSYAPVPHLKPVQAARAAERSQIAYTAQKAAQIKGPPDCSESTQVENTLKNPPHDADPTISRPRRPLRRRRACPVRSGVLVLVSPSMHLVSMRDYLVRTGRGRPPAPAPRSPARPAPRGGHTPGAHAAESKHVLLRVSSPAGMPFRPAGQSFIPAKSRQHDSLWSQLQGYHLAILHHFAKTRIDDGGRTDRLESTPARAGMRFS